MHKYTIAFNFTSGERVRFTLDLGVDMNKDEYAEHMVARPYFSIPWNDNLVVINMSNVNNFIIIEEKEEV